MQLLFGLIILAVVWAGFDYTHANVTSTIVSDIADQARTSPKTALQNATSSIRNIQEAQSASLVAVIAAIILTTALFGYLLARLALIPTRNSLNAQKQFIGNIAHELRTPLSIIKTNTEVALFDVAQNAEVRSVLTSTVEELDRISNIINNLLSLSAFVRPERIEFSNVDLGMLADTVLGKLKTLAERKRHALTLKKGESLVVWGNATALEQVIMNLLKNAITYTDPGGSIMVAIEPDHAGHVKLSIHDSGVGIARKDLFRIFEPFFRIEGSRSRLTGSSGLGLTIVSELVKLHHGTISIQSIVKRGTTVTVTLPAGKTGGGEGKLSSPDAQDNKNMGEITIDFSA